MVLSLIVTSERNATPGNNTQISPLRPPSPELSTHLPHHPIIICQYRSRTVPTPSPLYHLPLPPTQECPLLLLSSQSSPSLRPKSCRPSGLSLPLLLRTHLLPHLVAHLDPRVSNEPWSRVVWLGSVFVGSEDCLSALVGWWWWSSFQKLVRLL